LPLGSDSLAAVEQLGEVQAALRSRGIESLVGPPLNIGITNEGADDEKDGTYIYPGSLTVRAATLEALYVDLIRSLAENGLRRVFLYSGHLGGKHLTTVARAADAATREVDQVRAWALIDSERLERLPDARNRQVLPIVQGLDFPKLDGLLGGGATPRFTTHADGWETSLLLHFAPDVVRPGFRTLPDGPSLPFVQAQDARDSRLNPNGTGGWPNARASAEIGATIAAERTAKIVAAILGALEL
jgi:creatinine amidohydrolase